MQAAPPDRGIHHQVHGLFPDGNGMSATIQEYTKVHDHPSPSSFANLQSSQCDERTGEICFLVLALLAVLWLTLVYIGPILSYHIKLYKFVIVLT